MDDAPTGTVATELVANADRHAISVLFDRPLDSWPPVRRGDFVEDLRLDQVVAWLTEGRAEHRLADLFFAPCPDTDAIAYRHAVFDDLRSSATLVASLQAFGAAMRALRLALALVGKARYRHERELRLLEAAEV